jgi:hypothetical protein
VPATSSLKTEAIASSKTSGTSLPNYKESYFKRRFKSSVFRDVTPFSLVKVNRGSLPGFLAEFAMNFMALGYVSFEYFGFPS